MKRIYLAAAALLVSIFISTSCQVPKESSETVQNEFQEVPVVYSTGLRIWKSDSLFRIEVRNPQDTSELIDRYEFAILGDSANIPFESFGIGSTTLASFFDKLDLNESVTGLTFTDLILNKNIRNRIEKEEIVELTSGGQLDFEKVLVLNPEVFLAYSSSLSEIERLRANGIKVCVIPEYLESHPLGRAEWIKMIGCLTGRLEKAQAVFHEIDSAYSALKIKAALHSSLPVVFTGSRYKDRWYAPGKLSYIARYINDAAAQYTFQEIEGHGSAELDLEAALLQMQQADYWGMVVSQDENFTIEQLIEQDSRYETFPSVVKNQVFVCNSKKADYFGDGVVEPHLILADLMAIFHPNSYPTHTFSYFEPVK